jgi:guanylate kinase
MNFLKILLAIIVVLLIGGGIYYYTLITGFKKLIQFEQRIKNNGFLEYAEFVGNYYGTPLDKVESNLNAGNEVVLEIEVQGAMQVREKMKDAVFIFIAPPKMSDLKKRLIRRATEPEEVIQSRYEKACKEIELAYMYDYIVVNDTVENAADKIMAIIRAEHAKTRRTITEYMKMVEDK